MPLRVKDGSLWKRVEIPWTSAAPQGNTPTPTRAATAAARVRRAARCERFCVEAVIGRLV